MKLKIVSIIIILALLLSLTSCVFTLAPTTPPEEEPPEDTDGGSQDGIEEGEDGEEDGGEEPVTPDTTVVPTPDGYTFPTVSDETVYAVSSELEASALIDECISRHIYAVTIDFSALGADFNPLTDFDCAREFSSHVYLKYSQSESTPHLLTVKMVYRRATASKVSPKTPEYTYHQITNANEMLVRILEAHGARRPESFSRFPIDLADLEERAVYNSEELWWAVERGYRPVFAIENSSAERIYNKARDVLREIVTDGMSEFEKTLAIYEYIVKAVDYDYDALHDPDITSSHENVCYYLEGVFDHGRAVCDGKSKAFVLLCGIEGISAVREFGYGMVTEAGHAWNYVKVDGVWYVVDTTNGDASIALKPDGVSAFYGKNVQIIKYKYFLTKLSVYDTLYTKSGVWSDIVETDRGQERTSELLKKRAVDFTVDAVSELAELLCIIAASGEEEFVITLGFGKMLSLLYGDGVSYSLMNDALKEAGLFEQYEYKAWIESIDDNKNCMYTFKAISAEETKTLSVGQRFSLILRLYQSSESASSRSRSSLNLDILSELM